MDCDDVFVVLTRAPFPTGCAEIDTPTEEHLAVCDECQRFANALRPAPHLFHESLTPAQCRRLPGYAGGVVSSGALLSDNGVPMAGAAYGAPPAGAATARRTRLRREARRLLREDPYQMTLVPQAACDWRDAVALSSLGVAALVGLGGLAWLLL